MSTTATRVSRIPALTRAEAMSFATEELRRWLDVLRSLTPEEWAAPTECEPWDVRAMTCHVLGATESHALREMTHQLRVYRRAKGGLMIDAMTALQVGDRSDLTAEQIVARSNTPRRGRYAPAPECRVSSDTYP
jgi:hypothetical protein